MDGDIEHIWNDTLALAEGALSRPSFETWLRQTRPVASYDDLLVVAVPSDFARSYIQDRLSPLLREKLAQRVGRPVSLQFVAPPDADSADVPVAASVPADPPAFVSASPSGGVGSVETRGQPLNPKYTFETFVTASNSYLTYSAAVAVSEAPARVYNPLFIYGGVGLGKTHLLHAIGQRMLQRPTGSRIAYVSSETFANEMIDAIKDRTTADFRERYRKVDVLLVDDVQFLAGKESTQEEFFHTFNALYEANRQIVISSDHPPKEIPTLEDRLRSRFECGLITDVQPPDLETRTAILRKKAELDGLSVPDEAIRYIAEHITTNIRELEGALVRVIAYGSVNRCVMDEARTAEALRDILPNPQPRQITLRLIEETVADYYSLDVKDLKVRKRTRALTFPRQVAMYFCRELTDASLPEIGREFGRDHTTVMHAHDKITRASAADAGLRAALVQLRRRISG
jgi:chromosomal replication initiator protein